MSPCLKCQNTDNPPGASYCTTCGEPLPDGPVALRAQVAEQRNEVVNAISDLERGDSLMALATLKRLVAR